MRKNGKNKDRKKRQKHKDGKKRRNTTEENKDGKKDDKNKAGEENKVCTRRKSLLVGREYEWLPIDQRTVHKFSWYSRYVSFA